MTNLKTTSDQPHHDGRFLARTVIQPVSLSLARWVALALIGPIGDSRHGIFVQLKRCPTAVDLPSSRGSVIGTPKIHI